MKTYTLPKLKIVQVSKFFPILPYVELIMAKQTGYITVYNFIYLPVS